VQRGLAIQPAFEKTLADNYHASPTLLDFIKDPEAARSQINAWTDEHTKEKIKNLLPSGSVEAAPALS
jgi:serpin B